MQYVAAVRTAIQRVRVANGCTEDQISFENPLDSGYINPNAPADFRCHIFRPEGGGVIWQTPTQLTGERTVGASGPGIWISGDFGVAPPTFKYTFPVKAGVAPMTMLAMVKDEGVCTAIAKAVDQEMPYQTCTMLTYS